SDSALGQVGESLHRVRELVVQAANDSNTPEDRQKIKAEIDQIHSHIHDLANTKVAGKYIFSGTKTHSPLFVDGEFNDDPSTNINKNSVNIEVFDGIELQVNSPSMDMFKDLDDLMGKISAALGDETNTGKEIGSFLGGIANGTDETLTSIEVKILEQRAD